VGEAPELTGIEPQPMGDTTILNRGAFRSGFESETREKDMENARHHREQVATTAGERHTGGGDTSDGGGSPLESLVRAAQETRKKLTHLKISVYFSRKN
jgi:hypothetical protein